MKKLAFLFSVTLIAVSAFGQKLDNEFYFRFGYSSPSWEHFGIGKDGWTDNVEKVGGNFELGSIFMIQSLPAAENVAFGINVDYLYTNFSNFATSTGGYDYNLGIFRAGSKLGPSFSYSPVDKLVFDLYVKADLAWATVAVPYEDNINDAEDYYSAYTTLGMCSGLNLRYGILMLGVEYDTVSPELESDDNKGIYLQQEVGYLVGNGDSGKKSKLPSVNFKIGLSF